MGETGSFAMSNGTIKGINTLSGATSTLAGAYSSASAARMQGDYQKSQANINASLAEDQAQDAIKRGQVAAQIQARKTRQVIGAQRASAAAAGVNVDTGSAADLQSEASNMGQLDQLTIKNNAMREAYGYRAQGSNYRSQGAFAQIAGRNEYTSTLLTGGLRAISGGMDSYYRWDEDRNNNRRGT